MKSVQNRSSTDSDNKIMREKKLSVLYYFQAIQCHRSNQSQQSTHCHHMLWYHQLRQPGPQTMPIHIKKNPGYPDNARPIRTMYTWDLLNNCHIQITRNVLHHINSQLIVNSLASCASRVVFKQSQKNWQMFASEHQFTSIHILDIPTMLYVQCMYTRDILDNWHLDLSEMYYITEIPN